jgi:hypothetical protein
MASTGRLLFLLMFGAGLHFVRGSRQLFDLNVIWALCMGPCVQACILGHRRLYVDFVGFCEGFVCFEKIVFSGFCFVR